MKTLTEIAAIFAKLDDTPVEKIPQLDKLLRNLTQRHYMPPDKQEGRAGLYGRESIIVLRMIYMAASFGLDRLHLDTINRWLRNELPANWKGELLTRLQEAVKRAKAGEDFRFHLIMDVSGSTWCNADWNKDDQRAALAAERANANKAPEIGRFTLPASTLISDLLEAMG